ncbi:MAG: hypothetical protein NT154_34120, partial [Verrucomicrobia bacterium]|nr:hypothetical protein [Verrucomicrobiota bacterium]
VIIIGFGIHPLSGASEIELIERFRLCLQLCSCCFLHENSSEIAQSGCYYLYVMRIMSQIAQVLGNAADEAQYKSKALAISSALNTRFFNADGNYYLDRKQTHLLMPLLADAVPLASVKSVMNNLEDAIVVAQKGHLDVGDPGIYYLTKYLTETDRSGLVLTYASQTTYPS